MKNPAPQRFLTFPQALALVLGVSVTSFAVLYAAGILFFWNQDERIPALDRQLQTALANYDADPRSLSNLLSLGEAYFQKGMYDESLAPFRQALAADPRNYRALLRLGEAYLNTGQPDRAVSALRRAVEGAPSAFEPHYSLGLAYLQLGKLQEARAELRLAYGRNRGSAEVIYQLGVVSERLEDFQDARSQYESVLQLDPQFQPAVEALERLKTKPGGG